MTAVVGILNQQGVAIAADSAVTVTGANGRKIFNQANKVFTLSKRHPVGVMIYNSANLMGVPWETIIKIFREELAETSYETLEAYQINFISFLHDHNFFLSEEDQLNYYHMFLRNILREVVGQVVERKKEIYSLEGNERQQLFLDTLKEYLLENIKSIEANYSECIEFRNISPRNILSFLNDPIQEAISETVEKVEFKLPNEHEKLIKQFFVSLIKHEGTISNYTGLIFTGFGEKDIYPKLISLNVSLVVEDRLKYFVDTDKEVIITNSMNSAIRPFAQTDVINTILSGVAPELENTFLENFGMFLDKYNSFLMSFIKDEKLQAQINSIQIQPLVSQYAEEIKQMKTNRYIQPLMNAVSSLSKEDLSEMAESLIYLTYLKRRITFAEESVGGPVDVAIISKGDGFIWMKRKHYFKPELNNHFFDNYFKF